MDDRITNLAQALYLFLAWFGMCKVPFIDALREVVRINKLNVIALVETHMRGTQAVKIASLLYYYGHMRVNAQGFSGGI